MHVLLQGGDATLLLGTPASDVNPLPAAAGSTRDAGHDVGPRVLGDVGECRIKRLPEPKVECRSVATHCVLGLRNDLPE
eukprot:8510728-Heterocapsa_arctica.AAC.1